MLIEKAMEEAQSVTETAINEHWQAFLSIMRDKVGVENITLNEPYLKFEIVRNTLKYLQKLDKIPDTTDNLALRLNGEKTRHVIRVKQSMDERRQQEFGVAKYIWRTAMDERVRPEHAANEGKIFLWGDDDPPGTDENCRCWAVPFIDGAGTPTIEANFGAIARLLAAIAGILGRGGRRGTPPRKPSPSPKPVDKLPAEKPKLPQGKEPPTGGRNNTDWKFGKHKSETKWDNQMEKRGWTKEKVTDTIKNGKEYPAPNKVNQANTATRYEKDGKFVVRDDQTGELLQVGDDLFKPNIF